MEVQVSMSSIVGAIVVVTLVTCALKIVNCMWLRPKKIERCLRKQGLRGNPYSIFLANSKEASSMEKEAVSRPIDLSDDIVPRLLPSLNHIIEKYGKDSFSWIGRWPGVIITRSEQIKDVSAKLGDVHRPEMIKLLGNGSLSNLEEEEWAKHRKIINPTFHIEKLKLMPQAIIMTCSEMISKWENLVSAKGSCELDVWPFLRTMTGDVMSRIAFGSSLEEGRMIFQLQLKQVELILNNGLGSPNYFSRWRLNKRNKKIDGTIDSLLKGIINKREASMKAGEAAKDDLLGILLESNKNAGMSLAEVIGECKGFNFAGQETTSVTLLWALVLLAQHQTWQDRARAEVLRVFGDEKPDYERLNRLKIMPMILNEVLRLYPPTPMLARIVHKETKLGNLTVPAGVHIALPIILVHHDPEIWGDDVKEFKPERFAEGVANATKNQVSFLPFGWGPRKCIGQNFALMEAKLALTMILQRFWFELSPSYVHAPIAVISCQPQHGCPLILHKH